MYDTTYNLLPTATYFLLLLLSHCTIATAQLVNIGQRRKDGPLTLTPPDHDDRRANIPYDAYDDYDDDHGFDVVDPAAGGVGPPPVGPNRRRFSVPPQAKPGGKNNFLPYPSDCRTKTKTLPHEKFCDLYYTTTGCDDSQALLRSCPNGLLYTGSGRFGLIGVCDYPHNVHCGDKERHSK